MGIIACARMHSALTIEDVLVKHPKLRVYIMHAGYPMIDDLLAVLYAHPQAYVDVGIIVYNQPRRAFIGTCRRSSTLDSPTASCLGRIR